jgi:hypothetical protein
MTKRIYGLKLDEYVFLKDLVMDAIATGLRKAEVDVTAWNVSDRFDDVVMFATNYLLEQGIYAKDDRKNVVVIKRKGKRRK